MENLGMINLFNSLFKGKTVLVTGHTGFKGSWLCIWLRELGANVVGYALDPYTYNDIFVVSGMKDKIKSNIGDVRDYGGLKGVFDKYQPEIVFHLAAQPLVRMSYKQPKLTYETNVGGTVNLLECCRLTESVKIVINVTSDKCYDNQEWIWGYRENDRLGGFDPYSSSKGCSELITAAYRDSFFSETRGGSLVKYVSSVRAGNVIGGGDWREDRLVPDCIRALKNAEPIIIRSPGSVRPWQHVLDPLSGYLLLASRMFENGGEYSGAWNFGPEYASFITVSELTQRLIKCWGSGRYKDLSEGPGQEPHETRSLTLDISKAVNLLKWKPALNVDEAIEYTVNWYKAGDAGYNFCVNQIRGYIGKMLDEKG